MDTALGNRLIDLRNRIVAGFNAGNWEEIGLLTDTTEKISGHPRLLRSLSWGDEDYAGNVLTVLRETVEQNPRTLPIIEEYLDAKFPGESTFVSAKPSARRITFSPYVFQVPDTHVELDVVAVMMPFSMNPSGKQLPPASFAVFVQTTSGKTPRSFRIFSTLSFALNL